MNFFTSFDGIQIAYHNEGKDPAIILLHGGYVDGLGRFRDFNRVLPQRTPPCLSVPANLSTIHAREFHD